MIQYRRYTPADRDAVLRLLTEEMTPAQAAAKSATFDWQFGQNPHDNGRSPFFLGIANGGVVAVQGLMPARVIYQGTHHTAVWACDARVSVPFRGRGISTELKERLCREADIVLGYGMSDATNRILHKARWELSRELAGYFFHANEPGVIGALKNLRARLYRFARRRVVRDAGDEVTVRSEAEFGPEVDELWAQSAQTYFSAVERDAAYLNWKYRRHPWLSYRWYAARRKGRLSGLLVARPDADTSVIVDYCGPLGDDELMADLVDTAVGDLCDRGTVRIHCQTTDPGMSRALRRDGFRESRGNYRFRVRRGAFDDPSPSRRFFLMTGDSDNDFTVPLTLVTTPRTSPEKGGRVIEYRRYTPVDRDVVLRLLTEEMTPTQAAAKSATFDWQFGENPHDNGRSPFVVALANGVVVAVNGIMPARIIYQGTRCTAVWSCDSLVSAPSRGRGIGSEMMKLLRNEADVLLGYGMTDPMNRVLEKAGWELSRELAGYYFHANEPGATGALKNLRARLYRIRRRMVHRTAAEVTVHATADFGPEVDELWARSASTYFSAVERDAAYLNWKYRRHPSLSYCWYAARQERLLSGLLVARPDTSTSVIADYCGPLGDGELMADLVDTAVSDLCDRGTARIRCETTDPGMAAALRRNGFREASGVYRFRVRRSACDDPSPSRGFFLMTGDSDNDLTAAVTLPPAPNG